MPVVRPPIKRYQLHISRDLVLIKLATDLEAAVNQLTPILRKRWEDNGKRYKDFVWSMKVC